MFLFRSFIPVVLLAIALPTMLSAQHSLKTPNDFLPHRLGEQFTPHHLLTDYFEYLAANAPQTMRLERYGQTTEARPLQVAFFSTPENLNRLEQIRENNLRIATLGGNAAPDLKNAPVIVWLTMSVHGNEPSGSECSMELAHRLALQTDPKIKNWLKNTVVIIDPAANPDGYDHYSHWNRLSTNKIKTPNPESREHREPWPGGRPNHYYHDLNRDWAWATQTETQQRLKLYHRWLPHIHADLHEQYKDDPYYFAPAAEPMHAYITKWQREFQTEVGKNHARYFDAEGWLYFTKEVFDLLYPSYGDTYPLFNGAIGMTYEQGGHSLAGRSVLLNNGDTLTLHDRMAHHLTASLSTIEIASQNATRVIENFRNFYVRAANLPPGPYVTFVIRGTNDANKINNLCRLLDQHHIRYGMAGQASGNVKGFDYVKGRETTLSVAANDLIISAYQPKAILVQALFEPEPYLSDSMTYDITAWALPFAHGLEAAALKTRMEPQTPYTPFVAQQAIMTYKPYAWCIHRRSLAEARMVSQLLQEGLKVRYARKPFAIGQQQFDPGALVVTRGDNPEMDAQLDEIVQRAAQAANVIPHPISTGLAGRGSDLGAEAFQLLSRPEVAIVYGEEVDANSYGHTWFFLEQQLGYPLTALDAEKLGRFNLDEYDVLIFPDGSYSISESEQDLLKRWVREGGRLIVMDGAVKAFADKEGFDLTIKSFEKKSTGDSVEPESHRAHERSILAEQLPGAIVKAQVDNTHPLCYGFPDYYFSLKTQPTAYSLPDKADNPVWLGEKYQSYGFIGSRLRGHLQRTALASIQKMGSGEVIYFVDNPLFRSFWEQGKMLFSNALFH